MVVWLYNSGVGSVVFVVDLVGGEFVVLVLWCNEDEGVSVGGGYGDAKGFVREYE